MNHAISIERGLRPGRICILGAAFLVGCGSGERAPSGAPDANCSLDAGKGDASGAREGGSVQDATSVEDTTAVQDATSVQDIVAEPDGHDANDAQDAGADGGGVALPPLKTLTSASIIDCSGKLPFTGALCQGSSCTVVERTLLAQAEPPNFDPTPVGPMLALGDDCRPHVVYNAVSYNGVPPSADTSGIQYVTRKDGAWTSEKVASGGAAVGLVVDPETQVPTVQVRSNDFANYDLWSRGTAWTTFGNISSAIGDVLTFRRDPGGKFHVLIVAGFPEVAQYGTYDGTSWTYHPLPWLADSVEFGAADVPNFFGLDQWGLLDQPAETFQSPITVAGAMDLVTDDDPIVASGTPHVLFGSSGQPGQLVHAARKLGRWTVGPVRWPVVNSYCVQDGDLTRAIGTTCRFDYEILAPYAIVGSGSGDVRMLYTRFHTAGTAWWMVSNSGGHWLNTDGTVGQSELWIAWPLADGSYGSAMLVPDFFVPWAASPAPYTYSGVAAVDALGRIHVVANIDGGVVYYVIAGAGGP